MLILGVGTGRCGTKSLVRLLSLQDSTEPTHERFGSKVRWNCPSNLWPYRLWRDTKKEDYRVSCDVAFYWTPHIGTFLSWADKENRDVRIVGLKRDKKETIESYDRWKPRSDHWSYHGYRETLEDEWDHCYPSFETGDKKEGIGLFWERVYDIIHGWEGKDERVQCFSTLDLNSRDGVREILSHCGYKDPVVKKDIKIKAPGIEEAKNSTQW